MQDESGAADDLDKTRLGAFLGDRGAAVTAAPRRGN